MIKLSQEQVGQVAGQAARAIRELAAENNQLKEKVASWERRERAEKIASEMQAKNLDPDTSFADKVQKLMSSNQDLDVVEQAVGLASQQVKLAALTDLPGSPSDAASAFEQAILE